MPGVVAVVDARSPGATPSEVTLDDAEACALGELRALLLSLPLASAQAAMAGGDGSRLAICHDGRLLEGEERTLHSLGVLLAPVVVIYTPSSSQRRARSPPPAARSQPLHAARSPPSATRSPPGGGEPAAAAPEPDTGPPEDATCRICFGIAYEAGAGRLISPCMCSGSMRYVHVTCLNDWRQESANPRSFYECDQCHYQYNVERTKWAAVLEDARVVRGFAAALLLLATCACALVLGPLGAASRFFRFVRVDPYHPYQVGSLVAAAWCWQLDVIVSGLLGVAAAGVAIAVRDAYTAHRHMTHSWVLGVATALASNDVRIYRVFALFGSFAAAKAALGHSERLAKVLLTKWGTMILEVRR